MMELLQNLTSAQIFQTSRAAFEIAQNYHKNRDISLSVSLFERVVEMADPLFATQALFSLADIWKELEYRDKLNETYKRISELPGERTKFADPSSMGVALTRTGQLDRAERHYRDSLSQYPTNLAVQANFAELLLVRSKFEECIKWSSRIAARQSATYQIVGRVFQGSAFYFLGLEPKASEQFQWVGNHLISVGSIPENFGWEFEDSREVLGKIALPAAVIVIQVLDGRMPFPEFVAKWGAMFPAAIQPSTDH
jgi:tetratricopeptide (TPR) repeat protein